MRLIFVFLAFFSLVSCAPSVSDRSDDLKASKALKTKATKSPVKSEADIANDSKVARQEIRTAEDHSLVLDEENAIPFFFEYEKQLKENHVRFETSMGTFTVRLFENVPYHRANLIYLTKKNYFDGTQFHRVVKDFIIQGGNTDNRQVAKRRSEIGRYLLPPDTEKNHRHHRGVISMPSSDRDNPHKLASPYEFFIVVTKPGSYHLDGNYTAFGEVIEGMDVVDRINDVEVDQGDWPMQNVYILNAEAF